MTGFLNILSFTPDLYPWLPTVVISFTVTIGLHYISLYALKKLLKASLNTNSFWDNTFIFAALKPLPFVIWTIWINFSAAIINKYINNNLLSLAPQIKRNSDTNLPRMVSI